MAQFRKKPVVIDAFRLGIDSWPDWAWDKVNTNDIVLHFTVDGRDPPSPFTRSNGGHVDIKTLEGVMRGEWGDYLIRGIKGEVYACKPDIFEATYEPV